MHCFSQLHLKMGSICSTMCSFHLRWAVRKMGVKEWLVSAVKSVYTSAKTVVRVVYCKSNCYVVKVGMH